MRTITFMVLSLTFISRLANCQSVENALKTGVDVARWVEDNFSRGKIPPFSFVYGGRNSDTFIKGWGYRVEKVKSSDADINETVYTYSERSGVLVVKCTVTWYNDFQAVEWVLRFLNNSNRNTPVIENVKAVNHAFSSNKPGTFVLHHANGCNSLRNDFQPFDSDLKIGSSIYMTPNQGRSSTGDKAFPFFNIESPAGEGVMVAIGWTGKWYADVLQKDEKSVLLQSGMERMNLYLFPGEEIRTPRICLLFWRGEDRMVGHNQFRRFVLAHHTPRINGVPVELPLSYGFLGPGPYPCNGNTCLTESWAISVINRCQQFHVVPENFWLDAGWYPNRGDWHNTGSWVVNKENFPNGLKPISDAAHRVGSKFLLWFEPERVRASTQLAEEHANWLIEIPDKINKLLDLGNREVLNWVINRISEIIKSEGIDIYRQDFNMDPWAYWIKADPPGRTGITEIRHIEGLYAFWDSLRSKFPNLIIDNCASGGRRLDLETISRTIPLTRTDYHGYEIPNGSQDNTYGLNFYLPLHGSSNTVRTKYYFRSNISSGLGIGWDINKDESQTGMQQYFQDYKRLRPYFYGDYYPLTGTNNLLKDNTWLAYQLDRPEKGDGIVMAFRREGNKEESIQIQLKGIDKSAQYEIFYEDYGLKIIKTGDELTRGIDIYVPMRPGSLLISYKRLL
jgi:alpha-galactosidase